ncbi:MAG: hypothetical protein A4S09_16055 [Proteobacteria bacterium SG_bin7]|nr:MAG: hypothetical protein A4S09_16055 [Proteobacteria bacterium SG_bin7]
MKKILLATVAGLLIVGCESAPKKDEAKSAPTTAATKDTKASKDAKAKDKKQKGFEDEDISKTKPASSGSVSEGKTTCKNGGDERTLEMTSGDGKVCRLVYTKAGESKEVASGTSDNSKCNEIYERIKGNLEGAGFKCE